MIIQKLNVINVILNVFLKCFELNLKKKWRQHNLIDFINLVFWF